MSQDRYRHLLFEEREQIASRAAQGCQPGRDGAAAGGGRLRRHRELARNRLLSGGYQPRFAAGSYLARRERLALLKRDERLERFVTDRLTEGWET